MVKNWKTALSSVRSALMRRGHTEHDADDLVQEAWVRLATYKEKETVERPEAFLMRAALNLSIDAFRSRASRGVELMVEDVVLVDTGPSAEAVLLARERAARLSVCLGRLNQRTRDILLAHRINGLSYREIARQYQLSTTAVEKYIAKATLLLTGWMEDW